MMRPAASHRPALRVRKLPRLLRADRRTFPMHCAHSANNNPCPMRYRGLGGTMVKECLGWLLTAEELHSLHEVDGGPGPGEIPPEHRTRLIELGLVTERTGAIETTLIGQMRLSLGS